MKYIQCGVFACMIASGMRLCAMDNNQNEIIRWAEAISKAADQLPLLANQLPQEDAAALTILTSETFGVPANLRSLATDLKNISWEMIAKYKVPMIEKDIIKRTTDLFETEVKYLRPENASEGGKDRGYIVKYLRQLFKNKNDGNWNEIAENDVPDIPSIIDYMLANRQLNVAAQITLRRAKLDSKFHKAYVNQNIIAACLNTHLQGIPETSSTAIARSIQGERGHRYFAIKAIYQWVKKNDEADDDDAAPDGQEQNNSSQKRPVKKRSLEVEDGTKNSHKKAAIENDKDETD